MASQQIDIITGYVGTPHITSQNMRDVNMAIFGADYYIADILKQFAITIESNASVWVESGLFVGQGCAACIPDGVRRSLAIANGTQGMLRRDLIVARYNRNANNTEVMSIAVVTGTPAASNPVLPAYADPETYSIVRGDPTVEFPLYEVDLDGLTITGTRRLAPVVKELSLLDNNMQEIQARLSDMSSLIRYEQMDVNVSFEAGQLGTRGAAISLGATHRAGYVFLGAFILDHQNSSRFSVMLANDDSRGTMNVLAYRATTAAVSNATVRVRMMWVKSGNATYVS